MFIDAETEEAAEAVFFRVYEAGRYRIMRTTEVDEKGKPLDRARS